MTDAQGLAERCVQTLYARDRAAQSAGMHVEEVAPGYTRVSMMLVPEMINGHDTAHGGVVFTLADTAFAYACNSRNVSTLAQHCSITYVSAAHVGEQLTAEAREVHLAGRFGIYDVTVRANLERLVAVFSGRSIAVRGTII